MKRYITTFPMLLIAIIGIAQTANDTINRMVLVESTYNPIIVGAVKRNFIPEEVKPSMSKEAVVYADENVDLTNFDREAQPVQAVGVVPDRGLPGYAQLGYGNYNNLAGLATYKWRFGSKHSLALNAHADGWNGNLKREDGSKWRSHLYDTGLGADYSLSLGKALLNAGVHATHYSYNYLVHGIPSEAKSIQHGNDFGAYATVDGVAKKHYFYCATISYTHFVRGVHFAYKNPHAENHIRGEVSLGRDFYDWGLASVFLRSDVLTYKGPAGYTGYFSLGITPRWEYEVDDFQFVSGFNMDILGGEHIAHPFQMSPECRISYMPANRFSAQLTLDGGRDIHTFGTLYECSPYWASAEQILPTYTFLNARLEGGLRIVEGLHLHFGGGYRILSDALFETVMDSVGTTYTGITNHNAQVATVGGGISYVYKDLVNISTKADYHYWMLQGDPSLLARAPQLKVDVDARVRILPKLHVNTGLKLVTFTGADERAIIDWSLGANYVLNKRFSFFLDAHNLLNRRYSYYTGYPSQGFNVLLGAMVKF